MDDQQFVLTLTCPERIGIVHAVSQFLLEHGSDIIDNRQFGDRRTDRFFMRMHFATAPGVNSAALRDDFRRVASTYDMDWELRGVDERPRLLILVSKFGHCLNDLLYRWRVGALRVEIPIIVSNHRDFEGLVASYGVPFECVPASAETKPQAEERLLELIDEHRIDLVVLARYMQILSDGLCQRLAGRVINIHHSFLPSFKGAKPYHRAFDRGVKLVGATAHFVTPELDEGPIIDQEVIRVDHSFGPEELVTAGRDAECLALARAVQWYAEGRVFLNGHRTVVFD